MIYQLLGGRTEGGNPGNVNTQSSASATSQSSSYNSNTSKPVAAEMEDAADDLPF